MKAVQATRDRVECSADSNHRILADRSFGTDNFLRKMDGILSRFAVFAVLLSFVVSAQSEEVVLDPVIVNGSSIAQVPSDYIFLPADPVSPGNPMDGIQFYIRIANSIKVSKSIVDVRCVLPIGSDLAKITSRDDTTQRWLAAQAVYANITNLNLAADIKGAVIGKVFNPSDGKTYQAFKVTYADNGTEKWMIFPTPVASIKLFDTPLPGSMEYGDGVRVPSPVCGRG